MIRRHSGLASALKPGSNWSRPSSQEAQDNLVRTEALNKGELRDGNLIYHSAGYGPFWLRCSPRLRGFKRVSPLPQVNSPALLRVSFSKG